MAFTRPDALQKHIIGNRCAKRSAVENATASQAGQVPMQAMPGMIQSSMLTPPKHSSIQVQVPGRIVSGHQVMHARPRGPPPAGLMAIRYGKRRCTF